MKNFYLWIVWTLLTVALSKALLNSEANVSCKQIAQEIQNTCHLSWDGCVCGGEP